MNRIAVRSRIDESGILRLALPLGLEEAGRRVRVTVEPVEAGPPILLDEWRREVAALADSWEGDFERISTEKYEVRESMP